MVMGDLGNNIHLTMGSQEDQWSDMEGAASKLFPDSSLPLSLLLLCESDQISKGRRAVEVF